MYKITTSKWLKHWDFMLVDFILFQVAFFIACTIRHGVGMPYINETYIDLMWLIAGADLCVAFFFESYRGVLRRGYWKEFKAAAQHTLVVMAIVIAYLFLTKESDQTSRIVMVIFPFVAFGLIYCGRVLLKLYLRKHRSSASGKRSIVLICGPENFKDAIDTFLNNPYSEFLVQAVGIYPEHSEIDEKNYRGIPIYNCESRLLELMQTGWVDEILVSIPKEYPLPESLMETCELMGITVHIKLARVNVTGGKQIVEVLEGYTVLSNSMAVASTRALVLKRLLDICGGLVGTAITGLLIVIIGPIIKIKSPGPIFFSQTRVGKNGKPFKIHKFRSMYMDAEERKKELMAQNNIESGLMFKMDDDPRIIKGIGHFIRDYSIDEFPQFINVLKGEMSLVGTRPPLVNEVEQYDYYHRSRLATKPGITGMWQTSGRSDITDFEEVVRLDREYIENWSIGLDIKLLLKTVLVVLRKEGSK